MKVRHVRFGDHHAMWTIWNAASPRNPPEILAEWRGAKPWFDPSYRALFDRVEWVYVDGFDQMIGHFRRLELSMLHEGQRNPVVLTDGPLLHRAAECVPPWHRGHSVCESLGGSRTWVAQRHDLPLDAIVNDFNDTFKDAPVLETEADVRAHFRDQPEHVTMTPRGVRIGGVPYCHLPDDYGMAEQVKIRRAVLDDCRRVVAEWLADAARYEEAT